MPNLEYVIQSYDTAFSKKETADYSAITTWGVFRPEEAGGPRGLILLDSKKGRWDFPELKQIAWDQYNFWEPETVIIEAKASGMPLTHELRNIGIPVVNFSPSRGNDKVSEYMRSHLCLKQEWCMPLMKPLRMSLLKKLQRFQMGSMMTLLTA